MWALFSWENSATNPDLVECGSGFRKPQKILPLAAMAFQPKDYKVSTSTSSVPSSSSAPACTTTLVAATAGQDKCDRMREDEQTAANEHVASPGSHPFAAGSDSDASIMESLNEALKKGRKTRTRETREERVTDKGDMAKMKSQQSEMLPKVKNPDPKPRLKVVLPGPAQQTLTKERFDHFFDKSSYKRKKPEPDHHASSPPPPRDCATPQRKKKEPEIDVEGDPEPERVLENRDEDVTACGGRGEKLSGADVASISAASASLEKMDAFSCPSPTLHASDQSDQRARVPEHDAGNASVAATLPTDGLPDLGSVELPSVPPECPQVEVPDVPMPDQHVNAAGTAECGPEKTYVAASGVEPTLLDTPGCPTLFNAEIGSPKKPPTAGHDGDLGEFAPDDATQGNDDATNPVRTGSAEESSKALPQSKAATNMQPQPQPTSECLASVSGPHHVHDHGPQAENLEKQEQREDLDAEGLTFLFGPPGPAESPKDEEIFAAFGLADAEELPGKFDKSDKFDKSPLPPKIASARFRPNKYLARNILEGLSFHNDAMHFMDNDEEFFDRDALMQVLSAASSDSMSTSFSGIEAPHTASCANRIALAEYLGIPAGEIPMPRLLHMVEWGTEEQRELLVVSRQTGACLFGDIAEFFRPELSDTLAYLKDLGGSYFLALHLDLTLLTTTYYYLLLLTTTYYYLLLLTTTYYYLLLLTTTYYYLLLLTTTYYYLLLLTTTYYYLLLLTTTYYYLLLLTTTYYYLLLLTTTYYLLLSTYYLVLSTEYLVLSTEYLVLST